MGDLGDESAYELSNRLAQPEERRWYARALENPDRPGDRDKVRELLTEASNMYRQFGMPSHVELAENMLNEAQFTGLALRQLSREPCQPLCPHVVALHDRRRMVLLI